MSIGTHPAAHYDSRAHGSWISRHGPLVASLHGRHRRNVRDLDDGSAALLRRAFAAGAVWTTAFGLFSLAAGWSDLGLATLVVSAFVVFGVAASCLVDADAEDDDPRTARLRGVNRRRNGYRV